MSHAGLDNFLGLIQSQFNDAGSGEIDKNTDLKTLKEWSSLQTMIIVNEIDKTYDVILDFEDIKSSATVEQLFNKVQAKLK